MQSLISLLNFQVIDMFVGYLNEPNGTNWFLPTYFEVK